MNKTCNICQGKGRYKCPTCLIFYCSVICCKKHRQIKCDVVKKYEPDVEKEEQNLKKRKSTSQSEIADQKLKCLKTDSEVNKLLTNSHLRNLLVSIDKSDNAEEVMQKAMQEPIFVEFADACLKVVEPESQSEATQD